jgi:NDP-sugar pyrophosphorylase family protein
MSRSPQGRRGELYDALAPKVTADNGGVRALVLAGGLGTRLAPFTSVLPKPLMPIGNRAILEIVIDQLAKSHITDITLCVGHLSHLIRAVLDHREPDDVTIRYVQETTPLGTAGPLRLVPEMTDSFIVLNGDVLTTLDLAELVRAHKASGNILTIAAHRRTMRYDYGVLHTEVESGRIVAYTEKPELPLIVSMGIYVLEPSVVDYIPAGRHFDFPDLVHELLLQKLPVGSHLFDGVWFDIGRHEDYELAAAAWEAAPETSDLPPALGEAAGRL